MDFGGNKKLWIVLVAATVAAIVFLCLVTRHENVRNKVEKVRIIIDKLVIDKPIKAMTVLLSDKNYALLKPSNRDLTPVIINDKSVKQLLAGPKI